MLCTKYCCPQLILTKAQKGKKKKSVLGDIHSMILFPSAVSYKPFFFFLEVRTLYFFEVCCIPPFCLGQSVFIVLFGCIVTSGPVTSRMPLLSHSLAFLRHVTTPRKNCESRSFQRGSYFELHILRILNCIRSSCLKYYTYFNCKQYTYFNAR